MMSRFCDRIRDVPFTFKLMFLVFWRSLSKFANLYVQLDIEPRNLIPRWTFGEQPLKHQNIHPNNCYQLMNIDNIRRQTFFAYNTKNQLGAQQEATHLQLCLQALGFEIMEPLIDLRAEELLEELEAYCKKNVKTTSILIVVILTHGSWGRVHDKDDRWININEIQEPMTMIPHNIPKVLIIQACQGGSAPGLWCSSCGYDSAPPRDQHGSSDIHIQDLDMAIMVSTLWGQMSARNFFIFVLCQVLKEAITEPMEINKVFRCVCSIMTHGSCKPPIISPDHEEVQEISKLFSLVTLRNENRQLTEKIEAASKLSSRENKISEDGVTQIPCMLSTLRRKLYFDCFNSDSTIF